jgi:hypothetical protein
VIVVGNTLQSKTFRFRLRLFVLGVALGLLSFVLSLESAGIGLSEVVDNAQSMGISLLTDSCDPTVAPKSVYVVASSSHQTRLPLLHARGRARSGGFPQNSSLEAIPQHLFQADYLSVGFDRWFSSAISPVKTAFVFIC